MPTNPIPASDAILPFRRPVAYQHGDGVNIETLSAGKTLTIKSEQVQVLNGGASNRDITLPAPVVPDRIGHVYRIYNSGTTNNLVVKTSAGSTLATLLPSQWADVEHGPANYVLVAKGGAGAGGSDFGAPGLLTDGIAESTAGADVTIVHPRFGTATTLTIASGAVAATQVHHQLDTEGAAASDDLDSITGGAAGDILLLRLVAAARNVVLKHAVGANLIACPGGRDITLDVLTDWALLAWNGTQWTVVAASTLTDGFLAATNAWSGPQTFQNLLLGAASELTIASGAIAATRSFHTVDTEADAASDTLDDITGGGAGELLLLRPDNAGRSIILAHAIGANKIACPGAANIVLDEVTDWVLLCHDGTQWAVLASSVLAGTPDDVELYDPTATTKRARLDVGEVTAGQTRVLTVPDQNVDADQWIRKATGTIGAAALRTLNATPVEMIAAPAAGKYIKVLWVHWFLDYGGVAMDAAAAGDTLEAKYTNGAGAAVVDAVAGNAIGAAAADYHTTVLAVPEVIPVAAAAIVAHINVGEWYAAAGTSELKFVAYYQVCTLPT